jgi:bla regulator protein blaR1
MNFLYNIANESMINAIGWTLIHSVWQIATISLLLKISLKIFENKTAEFRHFLSVVSLVAIVFLAIFTFSRLYLSANNTGTDNVVLSIPANANPGLNYDSPSSPNDESVIKVSSSQSFNSFFQIINLNLPYLVLIWFIGIGILSLKFAGNLFYLSYFRKHHLSAASKSLVQFVYKIGAALKLDKKIQILESVLIKIPMVIGHFKPVILLPLGLAASLPPDQVEAIIIHEMAHIKRNDYFINLLKSLIEVFFFYHPGIWWITSVIETEREHCCDDIAIALCGSEKSLQKALLNLQQYSQNALTLAPALLNNKNKLLNRIRRMKTKNQFKNSFNGGFTAFVIIITGLIIFAASSAFSPKLSDLPDEYKSNNAQSEADNFSWSTTSSDNLLPASSQSFTLTDFISQIPDTTVKSSNQSSSEDKKITMEFDENYNLISVSKDGKTLEGDEKKEYEEMAAKMKRLDEQEKLKEEHQVALEKAEKELQLAQEQMEKAHQEYEKAISSYSESMQFSNDSLNTQVFVWSGENMGHPRAIREIKIDQHEGIQGVPHAYSIDIPDEDMIVAPEGIAWDTQYDMQIDKLENEMRVIEIEKEMNSPHASNKVIVKSSGSNDLLSILRKELMADGIIKDSKDDLSFSLTEDELEVNGEKLSNDLHKKYLKIYKQNTGNKLEGKFKIVIKD